MKLSPSTIAANLSAAAAAEAEAAANSNSTSTNVTSFNANTTVSTGTSAALSSINSTFASMSSNPPGKSTPKDTQVIAAILKEMGIAEYEPRVLPQLVEFAYRYSSRVLEDAQVFSSYARKKVIDTDDVSIAVQMQVDRSFVGPPSRDVLLEIARNKNTQPLPPIKSHNGMRLPADRYSLVASNLRLVSQSSNKQQSGSNKSLPRTGTSLLSKYSTTNSNKNFGSSQLSTSNSFLGGSDVLGIKRRLDET